MRLSHLAVSAALTLLGAVHSTAHADLLYRWDFNASDGANTGSGAGGTLSANMGTGATTGSFAGTGVSGATGDKALYTSNAFDYWWGTDLGNAAGVGNLDLTPVTTANAFTITMWVNAIWIDVHSPPVLTWQSNGVTN